MSIRNNICYGPRCQGVKNKEKLNTIVEQSLKDSALFEEVSDRLDASGLSLSGGQQQTKTLYCKNNCNVSRCYFNG